MESNIYNITNTISLFSASFNFKAYDASIPNYLHKGPRSVVEHCMKRPHSIDHFGSGDINIRIDGTSKALLFKGQNIPVDNGK